MLHILMMIIKIIGILILLILGIVLLIICSVLFVPITYQIHGRWQKEKRIHGRVCWFFSALSYSFAYENEAFVSSFQVFGIKRKQKEEKETKRHRRKNFKDNVRGENEKQFMDLEKADENQENEYDTVTDKITIEEVEEYKKEPLEYDLSVENEKEEENTGEGEKYNREEKGEKKGWIEKLKEKIFGIIYNIKCKIKKFCAIIKQWRDKWEWYRDFWQAEFTQNALVFARGELFTLLNHLKPKKIKGTLRIGLEDPAATGQIYGGLCVLQSFAFMDVKVIPEFEQKILEADLSVKGKVMVFTFLKTAAKLYFHKDVRQMQEQWKNRM